MANIEIHSSVLCIATEAPIDDNGLDKKRKKNLYAGLPNWAGYGSGIGIGIGYDIGASGHSPKQLQQLMSSAGIEQWVIDALTPYCYQTYSSSDPVRKAKAEAIVEYLIYDKKIRLTQQQCLDFLSVLKVQHNLGTQKYFPKSHSTMHDAVKEVFVKVHFGAPANCKFIGKLYDAKFSKTVSAIDQCHLCKEAMDTLLTKHGENNVYQKQYRSFKAFIDRIIIELENGNTVKIDHGPTTVKKLLQNDTFEFVAATANEVDLTRLNIGLEKVIKENDQKAINYVNHQLNYRKNNPITSKEITSKIENTLTIQGEKSSVINNQDLKHAEQIVRYDPFMVNVQKKLKAAGFYNSTVDGIFGSGTRAALSKYQKANGLEVSGQFDEETILSFAGKDYLQKEHKKQDGPSSFYFDWDNNIFDFVKKKKAENPAIEKTSALDWIREQAKDLSDLFKQSEQGKAEEFWAMLENATKNIYGLWRDDKENQKQGLKASTLKAALKGSGNISGTVGRNGQNNKSDVLIIRALLSARGYHDQSVWADFKANKNKLALVDAVLIKAIETFQSAAACLPSPDGRVDPGGTTLRVLNGGQGYTTPQGPTTTDDDVAKTLTASVGVAAVNKPADVRLIQQLLNERISAGLVVDGVCGPATKKAIQQFQQKQTSWADGRVDVGGDTWKALSASNSSPEEPEPTIVEEFEPLPLSADFFPCFN